MQSRSTQTNGKENDMAKANPGGAVDPDYVYGRDDLIERIWTILESQCACLNAERRIGKTCIIKKMTAEPRDGWFCVFQDLEKIHSADEFSKSVYQQIQRYIGWARQAKNKLREAAEDNGV
jgi:hypothetical protein